MIGFKGYMPEDDIRSAGTRTRSRAAGFLRALQDPRYSPGTFDVSAGVRALRDSGLDEDLGYEEAYKTGRLDPRSAGAKIWAAENDVNIYENPVEASRENAARLTQQLADAGGTAAVARPSMPARYGAPTGMMALDTEGDFVGPLPTGSFQLRPPGMVPPPTTSAGAVGAVMDIEDEEEEDEETPDGAA